MSSLTENAITKPRAPDERRQRIAEAAARSISRRGIDGLRVERVASEVGVSVSLLYYHYGDRNGLIKAAFEYASEQAPSTALRVAGDQRPGYDVIVDALLSELDDDPDVREAAIVWGEVSARAAVDADLRPSVNSITREWAEAVAKVIERGIEDGSIREVEDTMMLAQRLVILVDGLCARWLSEALTTAEARILLMDALRNNLAPAG